MANVTVLSNTIQIFNGERFYLCGFYFQHNGRRLHRVVWEYFNGPIPKGYQVHHKDGNRHNNDIANLDLLKDEEHYKHHAKEESRRENGRKAIKFAIEKAPEWHRSEAGKLWHGEHAREFWAKAQMNTFICSYCGKEYQSRAVRKQGNHFCCNNHKAAFRRKRLRDENSKD